VLQHFALRPSALAALLLLMPLVASVAQGQDCVPIDPDAPALRLIGPDQVRAGGQVLLQGKGFLTSPLPTVTIGGLNAPVVTARGDLGTIVATVPALASGVHSVHFRSGGTDSNALCVEVAGGAAPTACTLSGTARDDQGNTLPRTQVAALINDGEVFVQGTAADNLGNWSMQLPAGDYLLLAMPPAVGDTPLPVGFEIQELAAFGCPTGRSVDFVFTTGLQRLDINVVDGEGAPFPNASCDAESEELFAFGLSDASGQCSFMLPPDAYEIFVDTAYNSAFVAPGFLGELTLTGGSDPAPVQGVAEEGVVFCGTLVGPDGRGIGDGEVEALIVGGNDSAMGLALTASCTGEFVIAIPEDTQLNFVLFPPEDFEMLPTLVKEINISENTQAEFPFKFQSPGPLGLSDDRPHPSFIEGTPAAPGAPVLILGHGFGGSSPAVFFPAADGGPRIAAADVLVDADRGLILARVPNGAGTGEVVVRAGGLDGTPVPFLLDDEPFVEGTDTITGTVTAGGVPQAGAIVLLFSFPSGECDDEDVIADYAPTDGAGSFTLQHDDTGGFLDVLPPTSANLATANIELDPGIGSVVRNTALVAGIAVTVRVEDADSGARIPGAQVDVETDAGFDRRVTGSNGTAVLRLGAGGYAEGEVIPPAGSRYGEGGFESVIGDGSVETVDLTARNLVSGGLRSAAGPVVGGLVEGILQVEMGGRQFLHEDLTGLDGEWCVPFFNGANLNDRFALNFLDLGPEIAPLSVTPMLDQARDYILYPSFVAEAGGRIVGTITGAGDAGPLGDIGVQSFGLLPNGDIDWQTGATGFTRTCLDGTYEITTAVGDRVVVANQPFGDFNDGFGELWSTGVPCNEQSTSVAVVTGAPVTADLELPLVGRITGTIVTGGTMPLGGVQVEITDTVGGCAWWTQTDSGGFYAQTVPAASGYRVRFDGFGQGAWSACFDADESCLSPTLVEVTAGQDRMNVDYDFSDDCPGDPEKTTPGQCGCGVADEDFDGDGVADCIDNCLETANPDQANGPDADTFGDACDNCPNASNEDQEDADLDGTGDACDDCADDSTKTGAGQCGCGVSDADSDGDGIADCNDVCPGVPDDADGDGTRSCEGDACDDDPAKLAPGQCGCGAPDVGDVDGDGMSDALDCTCTPADLEPGGGIGLADWLVGWRVLNLSAPRNDRIAECGDLVPGTRTVCSERATPSWCADEVGDGAFTSDDLGIIRELTAEVLELDCDDCVAGGALPAMAGEMRMPGDVSGSPGGPDGIVDISDVLRVLRWAIQSDLELLTDELALRANVAPLTGDGSAGGDFNGDLSPRIDVSDVLVILRRAVGLLDLPWPQRTLLVDAGLEGVASQHRISGWPVWARFDGLSGCGTGDADSGMDVLDGLWVATCATDPASGGTDIEISYRAAEEVAVESLEGLTTALDAGLAETQAVPALRTD
jgi:hypothetical protein